MKIALIIVLAIFCVIRYLWVKRAIGYSCAYCFRHHHGKMPSMWKMLLYVWRWDALKITEHMVWLEHRKNKTGPYAPTPPIDLAELTSDTHASDSPQRDPNWVKAEVVHFDND